MAVQNYFLLEEQLRLVADHLRHKGSHSVLLHLILLANLAQGGGI